MGISGQATPVLIRHDWSYDEIRSLYEMPLNDLLFQAHSIHRQHFDPNAVQMSTLLNIKTGGCPEDCGYCSQSAHHDSGLEKQKFLDVAEVLQAAEQAKQAGATRFCMGAAWRSPHQRDMPKVIEMVEKVKSLGMETCMTLGMLDQDKARQLKAAGLDYYNHNLDTSPEFYGEVISTRSYDDRLDTLQHVRDAGINVCCGGILGMGERQQDRISLLRQLANLPQHPESVPINQLIAIPGTPLEDVQALDPLEFVRSIATARVIMPASVIRLSAGRSEMSDELQAMCFFAGANSIFYGDKLLTTDNPEADHDRQLFDRLGLHAMQ